MFKIKRNSRFLSLSTKFPRTFKFRTFDNEQHLFLPSEAIVFLRAKKNRIPLSLLKKKTIHPIRVRIIQCFFNNYTYINIHDIPYPLDVFSFHEMRQLSQRRHLSLPIACPLNYQAHGLVPSHRRRRQRTDCHHRQPPVVAHSAARCERSAAAHRIRERHRERPGNIASCEYIHNRHT